MRRSSALLRRLLPLCVLAALPTSTVLASPHGYRASSPEHGVSVFVYNEPETTKRDLEKARALGFPWVKSLFRWTDIEHDHKGAFDWRESDRVVRAATKSGVQLLARLDFQPWWARADQARNGPPDNVQDFADFVYAFATRYGKGSDIGRVHAIQVWNEPNLTREWGDQPVTRESAAEYVRLLQAARTATEQASPDIIVVSAGLAFTGVDDPACCAPADSYLQWMYEAGLKDSYDMLGVNANFICACAEAEPGSVLGFEHPSFYFRHVEQLRDIMVANGDADRQIWLTEFGWTSQAAPPEQLEAAEEIKGEQVLTAFSYAREFWSPWIGLMALWTLANPSWDLSGANPWDEEQAGWSITNPDGSHRPSYERLVQAWETGELPWQRNRIP